MTRIPDPIEPGEGETWAASADGRRVLRTVEERIAAIGDTGGGRRALPWVAFAAALVLVGATITWSRLGPEPTAGDVCPATVVDDPWFVPPAPYPETPPDIYEAQWYGTEDLWTMIPFEGASIHFLGDKLFFWSRRFTYGSEAFVHGPDMTVTLTRLDAAEEPIVITDVSNGTRPDIGTFMITGFEPSVGSRCYEVRAEYEGATLTYVARVYSDRAGEASR